MTSVGKFANDTGASEVALNRQTLVNVDLGLWERPAMTASMAFLRYMRELAQARVEHGDNDVFVCIVDSGGEPVRTRTLGPGESMIIGRHSKCGVQLNHGNVALRQIAVHVSHASTGQAPMMRIWDLHTDKPLTCEDGKRVESLSSDGPALLTVGRYHLAVIPLGQLPKTMPLSTNAAWAALPHREFISSVAEGTGSRLLPELSAGALMTTSVTRLPSSVGLRALESTPVAPGSAIAALVVQSPKKRREFAVGIEHLERGILIGRYGRCVGSGLDATVSRVHLLLTSVANQIVAIDTASTVGSGINRECFATRRVEDPCKIWLGKHSYLLWKPRPIASS